MEYSFIGTLVSWKISKLLIMAESNFVDYVKICRFVHDDYLCVKGNRLCDFNRLDLRYGERLDERLRVMPVGKTGEPYVCLYPE